MNWDDVIIGQNAVVTGELRSIANVYLRGQIEGRLFSDQDVYVLEKGIVKGHLEAAAVTLSGTVEGTVKAKKLQLNPDGQLLGDLIASTLIIEEGATFIGCSKKAEKSADQKITNFEPIYEL